MSHNVCLSISCNEHTVVWYHFDSPSCANQGPPHLCDMMDYQNDIKQQYIYYRLWINTQTIINVTQMWGVLDLRKMGYQNDTKQQYVHYRIWINTQTMINVTQMWGVLDLCKMDYQNDTTQHVHYQICIFPSNINQFAINFYLINNVVPFHT